MEIRIPKLGVAMTEGTIVQWLVEDGAAVAAGVPIYVLETDEGLLNLNEELASVRPEVREAIFAEMDRNAVCSAL